MPQQTPGATKELSDCLWCTVHKAITPALLTYRYKLIYFDARGVVETVRVMFYLSELLYCVDLLSRFWSKSLANLTMNMTSHYIFIHHSCVEERVPYIDFRFPVCCQTFARPEYDKVAEVGSIICWHGAPPFGGF